MKRIPLILALLLALAWPARAAVKTFGTGGTYATLVAALDAASAGDNLTQVGASEETLTSAKTYSAANLTITGDGAHAITVTTSGSGAIVFTGDGLAFTGCSDLRVPMRLNGADATFTSCTITHPTGSLIPGTQSLILLSGAAMSCQFIDCNIDYHADAPTCTKIVEIGSSHDYQLTFDGCTMRLGVYASSGATTSDLYVTDCQMSTNNWSLAGSGIDKAYFVRSSMNGKSLGLGNVADLQVTGGTWTVASTSNSYTPTTGMSHTYCLMAVCNQFIIDGATVANSLTGNVTDTDYIGFLLRAWSSPSTGCAITDCVSQENTALTAPWYAFSIESAWNSVEVTGNTFAGGALMAWTDATTDDQGSGWTVASNTFGGARRMPYGAILAIKASAITANTFSGNMTTALALLGSRTGTDDALSGDNVVAGNPIHLEADTCSISAILLTSAGNVVRNNPLTLKGTGNRPVVGIEETLPNSLYNNRIDLTNGTAAISAYGETGTCPTYNNLVTGTTAHVFDTGAAGALGTGYMDYPGIYRYCKTLGAETYADAFVIGYSALGRPIVAVKLSDNAASVENEPGLGLNGGIHGDEQPSCMIVTAMLGKLAAGYAASTSRYTTLLNASELWAIPVINPDGYTANHRANIWAQDPNREFPDGSSSATNTQPGWFSCEAGAVWGLYNANDIGVSASFHNNLNQAFYAWAGTTTDLSSTNLRNTCIALADAYVGAAYDASASSAEASTLGTLTGTELDWMLRYGGAAAITIEFPSGKQAAPSALAARWTGMEASVLAFLEAGLNGNAGMVTQSDHSSAAATGVTVKISGDTAGAVRTDANGYYFRPMKTGTSATLEFSGNGFTTATNASGTISGTTTLNKAVAGNETAARSAYSQTAQEAPTFTEASNCAAATCTAALDYGSLAATSFTDSLSWRMKHGGKRDLTGITANACGTVAVGLNPPTGALAGGSPAPVLWWFRPSGVSAFDWVAEDVYGLLALIDDGSLPAVTLGTTRTYYLIPPTGLTGDAGRGRRDDLERQWGKLSDANRAKIEWRVW